MNLFNKITILNYVFNKVRLKLNLYEKHKKRKYNLKRCNRLLLKEFEKIQKEITFNNDQSLLKVIDEFARYCAIEHKINHYNEAVKIILYTIEPQKCIDLMLIQDFRIKFNKYRDSVK